MGTGIQHEEDLGSWFSFLWKILQRHRRAIAIQCKRYDVSESAGLCKNTWETND